VATQAHKNVKRTPEMLPQLKEAGVVDAGGKGLFYVFLGMKQFFSREITQFEERRTITHKAKMHSEQYRYGFDLQFLIEGAQLPLDEIRNKILGMGDSVLVVGDEQVIRVHIHTKEPQAVLDYSSAMGNLKDVAMENMDEQVARFHSASPAKITHPQD
jgi:dihydroxyacetone kinase-like predicted kinase